MLAVPASAFALSGTAADTQAATTATPLAASVTPRHVVVNHPVTVSGTAPVADAGQHAVVQTATRRNGRWQTLARATVSPSGHFRVRTRLRHSGYIRVIDGSTDAVMAGAHRGIPVAGAAAARTAPQPVTVQAAFALVARQVNLMRGAALVLRGHLLPARGGRTVRLQGHYPGGWHTLADGRTGARGGFRLRGRPVSGVERHLRVLFAGDAANARAAHAAGRMTVYGQDVASWYDDFGSTACGFHAGLGVANRTLPCGTKVRFLNRGRSVTATVDDRGPYAGGRNWDLNQSTAAALGFAGVGAVWVAQ